MITTLPPPAHERERLLALHLRALRGHLLLLVRQRLLHQHHLDALLHGVLLGARHRVRLLGRQARQRAAQDGRQRGALGAWTWTSGGVVNEPVSRHTRLSIRAATRPDKAGLRFFNACRAKSKGVRLFASQLKFEKNF